MPLIEVTVIKDVFTPEQKHEIIERMTDCMVGIEGEALRGVTTVLVHEVMGGDWGMGGRTLTAADVHAMQGAPEMTAAG